MTVDFSINIQKQNISDPHGPETFTIYEGNYALDKKDERLKMLSKIEYIFEHELICTQQVEDPANHPLLFLMEKAKELRYSQNWVHCPVTLYVTAYQKDCEATYQRIRVAAAAYAWHYPHSLPKTVGAPLFDWGRSGK